MPGAPTVALPGLTPPVPSSSFQWGSGGGAKLQKPVRRGLGGRGMQRCRLWLQGWGDPHLWLAASRSPLMPRLGWLLSPQLGLGTPPHGHSLPGLGGLCPRGAELGGLLPELRLCSCCSFMRSFGFFLFLSLFGPNHRVLPHPGGFLYPAHWQHMWSPVCDGVTGHVMNTDATEPLQHRLP